MSFRRLQWLFPVTVTLHNAEEAITYPIFLATYSGELKWAIEPSIFVWALIGLTIAAWIVTYLSWRNGPRSLAAHLTFGYAAAMLVNVFAPHVPLAIWLRGYTPGLFTAVAVNLPCLPFLLVCARSEDYVAPRKAAVASIAAVIGGAALAGVLSLISIKQ